MKLYEIANDYEALVEAIETGEIPEEAIADTLEGIEALLEDKADNIACLIKNIKADVQAIRAEELNLAERRKSKESQIERLTAYLSETLQRVGISKMETVRNKISFRKSESVSVADEGAFIAWAMGSHDDLLTYKDPTINKTAIKKALSSGEKIEGAVIENKLNIQIK